MTNLVVTDVLGSSSEVGINSIGLLNGFIPFIFVKFQLIDAVVVGYASLTLILSDDTLNNWKNEFINYIFYFLVDNLNNYNDAIEISIFAGEDLSDSISLIDDIGITLGIFLVLSVSDNLNNWNDTKALNIVYRLKLRDSNIQNWRTAFSFLNR